MTNIKNINESYDDIDFLLNNKKYNNIRKYLSNIIDLERIKRKMVLNKMAPLEWIIFNESLESSLKIYKELQINDTNITLDEMESIIKSYDDIIDLDKASKYNLTDKSNMGNFFKKGIYPEIDDYVNKSQESYKIIEKISNEIIEF